MASVENRNEIQRNDDPKEKKDPHGKQQEKLIEVKKEDTARDSDNEFIRHEEPSDEQMFDGGADDVDEDAG